MTRSPRYDPDENVSRHGATDPDKCEEMADKHSWNLVRVEETGDAVLEVDCVFEGETQFPPSPYEPKHEREEQPVKRWIVFKTASASSQGWKERKLQPTGHLTRILAEYLDCSDKALPEVGYRPREFACFEESVDPNFPHASTHVRWSDWQVSRVERFKSIDSAEYDEVVVCYCCYSPIEIQWKELPQIGVLQEGKL